MRSLSANLDAFFHDLDAVKTSDGKTLIQHVPIVLETEFGRTVNENGNQGTDHGQGGVMMFLRRNVPVRLPTHPVPQREKHVILTRRSTIIAPLFSSDEVKSAPIMTQEFLGVS